MILLQCNTKCKMIQQHMLKPLASKVSLFIEDLPHCHENLPHRHENLPHCHEMLQYALGKTFY